MSAAHFCLLVYTLRNLLLRLMLPGHNIEVALGKRWLLPSATPISWRGAGVMHDSRPLREVSRGVFLDGLFRAGLGEAHEMRSNLYVYLIAFCVTVNPRRELMPAAVRELSPDT